MLYTNKRYVNKIKKQKIEHKMNRKNCLHPKKGFLFK